MTTRARLGRIGEQLAVRHLERAGYVVVARNWRCAQPDVRGELDVLARDGDTLVVCEVKTRRNADTGGPLAAVTPAKLAQLRRLAAAYLAEVGPAVAQIRFDIVGVSWERGRPVLDHLRGV